MNGLFVTIAQAAVSTTLVMTLFAAFIAAHGR